MPSSTDSAEQRVAELYHTLLGAWNAREAARMAAVFAADGAVVGFDGSQIDGRAAIQAEMARIFTDHQTGAYVGVIRQVQLLGAEAAVLRAVAGVVPHGRDDIAPALNTIQSLVAVSRDGVWQVLLYHNTPAQFHGRPDLAAALTAELRALLPVTGG